MVEKKAAKKTVVKSEKKAIRKTTAKTAARAAAAADKQYASADVVQEKKAIRQIKSNNKKDVKEIKKLEKKNAKSSLWGIFRKLPARLSTFVLTRLKICRTF